MTHIFFCSCCCCPECGDFFQLHPSTFALCQLPSSRLFSCGTVYAGDGLMYVWWFGIPSSRCFDFLLSILFYSQSCSVAFDFQFSSVISGVRSTAALAVDIRNIGNLSACQVSVNLNLFSSHATFLSIDETQWTCGEFGYQSLTCRPAPANRHFGAIGPGHVVRKMCSIRYK